MADERARQALADVEAQRDDAVAYLGAIKRVLEVPARGHGVRACAQEIVAALVHELSVESCALALRAGADGELGLAGFSTQSDHMPGGGRTLGEAGWLALARLVRSGPSPAAFQRASDGGFAAVGAGDLNGEGVLVLPVPVGDETGGALVLHWLVAPAQVFGRAPALALVAEIVGQALTIAQMRDATARLYRELADELGVARRTLSVQEEGLRSREESIEKLTQSLIRSNRVKREFLGTVSHELRTPLNAILGYASLLRDGQAGAVSRQQTDFLDRVLGSSRNLHALIDDLLFFVQMEADRVLVRPERVDARELVDEVLAALPDRPPADRVALEVQIAVDVGQLDVDPSLVRRMLFHLVCNAFKFTPRGEVRIAIEPDGEQGAFVTVEDSGIGIAPGRVDELFELFAQGDTSTTRRYNGLGMGLTLVQRCVRLMRGEMQVESRLGVGTVFRVHLPRVLVAACPAASPPAARTLH